VHFGRIDIGEGLAPNDALELRRRSQYDGDIHPELGRDRIFDAAGTTDASLVKMTFPLWM
jgi:hypothetical protein